MKSKLPSPALIVACFALIAALAGTSFASTRNTSSTAETQGVIHVQFVTIPSTSRGNGTARCPRGTRATGGGAYLEGTVSSDDHIIDSEPVIAGKNGFRPQTRGTAMNWHVSYYNPNAEPRRLDVFVICTG